MLNLPVPLSLILGIDGNLGIFPFQKLFRLFVDEFKLGILIRICSVFKRLAIGGKLIFHFVQQLADLRFGNVKSLLFQQVGQVSIAVWRPPQGRHGIVLGGGVDDGIQGGFQRWLFLASFFSSAAGSSGSFGRPMLFSVQFLDSPPDRWSGDSRCACDEGDGLAPKVDGFRGRPKSPLSFVENLHERSSTILMQFCKGYFWAGPYD